jgi:2-C-methyl-D-erythritol 4-phosphate cytidylyltransferase
MPNRPERQPTNIESSLMPSFAVIVPAAGRSTRFGQDKLAAPLLGRPVLQRSVMAFLNREDVSHLIIATNDSAATHAALTAGPSSEAILAHPKLNICAGGAHRAQSVRSALGQIPADVEWVAVHDAARPLVCADLIDRTFAAAIEHGAAVPALPVHLTVKQAVGPLPAKVIKTLPRHELWAMQTPQVMRRADLLEAFSSCPIPLEQVTDDVQLLELAGKEVWLVPGEEKNLKITTAADIHLAELYLSLQ